MSFPSTLGGRRPQTRPRADHRTLQHRAVDPHPRPVPSPRIDPEHGPRPQRRLGRRPVLDGVRGIAVLLVICEHTGIEHNGFVGVDVFFVLSGFLITTLLFEEWERRGRISLGAFYGRRARRLLPALTLLAFLAIAVQTFDFRLGGWSMGLKLATTFSFINNWVAGLSLDHGQALGVLNPTWSLAQEDQFYLLWPLALILLLHLRARPGQILALLGTAIAALLVFEPAIAALLPGYSAYYSPVDRSAELLLGCGASLVWRHRMVWLPRSETRLTWPVRLAVESLCLALTGAFLWLLLDVHPVNSRWVYLGAAGITVPGLLLLIQAPQTLLGRCVGSAPLRAIGRISYGLYLIHLLLRSVIQAALPHAQPPEVFSLTLAVSIPLAALSYRFIEQPVLRRRWPLGLATVGRRLMAVGGSPDLRRVYPIPQPAPRPIRSTA